MIKRLAILLLGLTVSLGHAFGQHFGGVRVSPLWQGGQHIPPYPKEYKGLDIYNFSFGYSIGYQGMLFPKRLFSFTYGIQYLSLVNERSVLYDDGTFQDFGLVDVLPGYYNARIRYHIDYVEVPISVQLNFLRSYRIQPFISLGFSGIFPFGSTTEATDIKNSQPIQNDRLIRTDFKHDGFAEFGFGAKYVHRNMLFMVNPNVKPWNNRGHAGVAFSILKKF